MSNPLYPLYFKPIYKDYVWGGQNIITTFHRDAPPGVYAESWEVSDRSEGMSIVTNGSCSGKTLHELISSHGTDLLGPHFTSFPLLLKLIDAHQNLSIQVHPSDEDAKRYGGEAKAEAWYVLDAGQDACIYAGLKEKLSEETLRELIASKKIVSALNKIPVSKGEMINIPGGRMHAIGKDCLIYEMQQNSNTTYRVYDWERGRPLHIEKAMQVIKPNDTESPLCASYLVDEGDHYEKWSLLETPYFTMEKVNLQTEPMTFHPNENFEVLFCLSGEGEIKWEEDLEILKAGMSYLIPASLKSFTICPSKDISLLYVKPHPLG